MRINDLATLVASIPDRLILEVNGNLTPLGQQLMETIQQELQAQSPTVTRILLDPTKPRKK